jgi:hypothetical protein
MRSTLSTRRLRLPSAVLGVALLSGAFLASAAPANAEVLDPSQDDGYTASGTVSLIDAEGAAAPAEGVELTLYPAYSESVTEESAADGTFSFGSLPFGDYVLQAINPDVADAFVQVEFTVEEADVALPPIGLLSGTVELTGEPVVGSTLTAKAAGWPAGTALSYEWGYSFGQGGGGIEGATTNSQKITEDLTGRWVVALVTGKLDGYEPMTYRVTSDIVTAPKKAAAAPPVANSGDLGSYLVGKGSTPLAQDAAGLPEGSLSPSKDYEATVDWWSGDSYVDVYLYSTPVFVGTFPVVNGVVQISLSADVLSELGAGAHTLVVLGQSSGDVSSVTVSLAAVLASTGVDPIFAFSASGFFLLLGAAALFAARRMRQKA